jgi:hypothetical protein
MAIEVDQIDLLEKKAQKTLLNILKDFKMGLLFKLY